ncbi:MAG: PQQ-dependent sugar dehydrogenase [Solirubrobacteraceae bacterium]|nr:PQQ-dependent sugar dehydrogenase [Solirubrobacteraceae bacterium]
MKSFARGFKAPLWVGHAPGDSAGVWVAQQNGQLYRVRSGKRILKLSIASRTKAEGEQGLLGVAFLPDYAKSKLLVLSSTNKAGDSRVELWKMGSSAKRARLVRTLLRVKQPFSNHNGGNVIFGAGNTLYFGLGDGGSADDPNRVAQTESSILGKIVRTTVSTSGTIRWLDVAYGLRNPWRFWFDKGRNELWVGDVGQNAIEEVDRIPLGESKAPNLGWSVFEGGQRDTAGDDALSGDGRLIWPVAAYRHGDDGCSITGGEIYSGTKIGALKGRYVYGDFCSGRLWSVEPKGDGVGPIRREAASVPQLTSFGSDTDGELYATSGSGTVYKLTK